MKPKGAKTHLTRRDFLRNTAGSVGATAVVGMSTREVIAQTAPWNRVADVVVVGAGAAGLPAAIRARDLGASVILVEENTDIGGHAILSGGIVGLGGGTRLQKKYGIEDSADKVYLETTRPDHPHTRFSDRKLVRAFANINVEAFDFLEANGVKFADVHPTNYLAGGTLTDRWHPVLRWSADLNETINGSPGSGLARALEKSARAKGVEILLRHRMTNIIRESPKSGRVLGITTTDLRDNSTVNIQARKGVIACTGGSSGNVFIRTMYDPRLTEEYHAGGEPWSRQSGDAEQMGLAIGAALGSTSNARTEAYLCINKASWIACWDGYMRWNPNSPVFSRAGASGISVADYQDVILVNAMGKRFFNELQGGMNLTETDGLRPMHEYCAAAFASAVVDGPKGRERIGGPIWAIFDADAAKRENWDLRPPYVDVERGYFFSADTLRELAGKLANNREQKVQMPPTALQDTVTRYNSFVDSGTDGDFGKPAPRYKIQKPPFYAAWATPVLHDTWTGLRINERCQVIDIFGNVIPGFYCAGESAGGFALHGLGRCIGTGYIAGTNVVV